MKKRAAVFRAILCAQDSHSHDVRDVAAKTGTRNGGRDRLFSRNAKSRRYNPISRAGWSQSWRLQPMRVAMGSGPAQLPFRLAAEVRGLSAHMGGYLPPDAVGMK